MSLIFENIAHKPRNSAEFEQIVETILWSGAKTNILESEGDVPRGRAALEKFIEVIGDEKNLNLVNTEYSETREYVMYLRYALKNISAGNYNDACSDLLDVMHYAIHSRQAIIAVHDVTKPYMEDIA